MRPAHYVPAEDLATIQTLAAVDREGFFLKAENELYRSIRQQPLPRVRRRTALRHPDHIDEPIKGRPRLVVVVQHGFAAVYRTLCPADMLSCKGSRGIVEAQD